MYIDVPDESMVEGPAADWYERQRNAWGYLPNYAPAFALRPNVAEAWNALNGAVRANMDRRRFELATIAAARVYRSTYCTAAHSKFLRDDCGDEAAMRTMAADPTGSSLDEVDRAVIALATKVATDASSVTQADVDALKDLGLTDTDVSDIVFAAAARAFFTKALDGLGVQADAQLAAMLGTDLSEQLAVGRPFAS